MNTGRFDPKPTTLLSINGRAVGLRLGLVERREHIHDTGQ